ncbi:MAG: HAD-IB family hydrolase [Pseudomonadota bacterium]
MREMVIYDMDKTVTLKATYAAFLMHVAWRVAPWRLLLVPVSALLGLGYLAGLVGRSRLKELNQQLFVGAAIALDRIAPHVESYADKVVAHNIRPGARRRITADREAGCLLMMATASYELYAAAIARRLGFDVVLGTKLVCDSDGRVTARIDGDNCYGEAKRECIENWRNHHAGENGAVQVVRTYSDHVSDVPMLLLGAEPVAINPHQPLAEYARTHGWHIVDWRT